METKIHYSYSGIVYGNCWGGGKCGYSSIKESGFNSIEELLLSAEKHLEDGSLDSGMGFESLIGALLIIDTIKEVVINEEVFCNVSTTDTFIGNLTEEQEDFLYNCSYR